MASKSGQGKTLDVLKTILLFSLMTAPFVTLFQLLFSSPVTVTEVAGVSIVLGTAVGLFYRLSEIDIWENSYRDVTLAELLENDLGVPVGVASHSNHSSIEPELVLPSVEGSPVPQLVAGGVAQERLPDKPTVEPQMQAAIEKTVAYSLANLPPMPSRPPRIHHVSEEDGEASSGTMEITSASLVTFPVFDWRAVLESKPIREVAEELGPEAYIEGLQHCLTLSKPGSPNIVLNAKGKVHGLGARGIRNEDGSTDFTRSDVLKLLKRARQNISASL